MRKPRKDEFIRVHPDIRVAISIYADVENRLDYLLGPDVIAEVETLVGVRRVLLSLTATYGGEFFGWPVPVPSDVRANRWHATAFQAAEQATRGWIRLKAATQEYEIYRRTINDAKAPTWPEEVPDAEHLLRLCFGPGGGGDLIDDPGSRTPEASTRRELNDRPRFPEDRGLFTSMTYAIDFEYFAAEGERPRPHCLCWVIVETGEEGRLWIDDTTTAPTFGRDGLIVAHYALAELGLLRGLGVGHPPPCDRHTCGGPRGARPSPPRGWVGPPRGGGRLRNPNHERRTQRRDAGSGDATRGAG